MPNYAITLTKERSSVLKKNEEKQRQHFRWRERWMEKSETERDGAFRLYLAGTTEHELITHKYIAAATPRAHNYTFNTISLSQTLSFSVISPSGSAHLGRGLAVIERRRSVLKPFLILHRRCIRTQMEPCGGSGSLFSWLPHTVRKMCKNFYLQGRISVSLGQEDLFLPYLRLKGS